MSLTTEIAKRRTFAIISHPDAGKTTLTEKLLLYSGLLRTAGIVKNRKAGGKNATSDWMGMEQERGISITSSAMQFRYGEAVINVLDTPGHQDFSEDTYRTLTAADCAIMVIDAAKGVETQTRKLFEVCRLRGIPVLTFINKCDLPGRDPVELMAEVEDVLGIQASALNYPSEIGRGFDSLVDRRTNELLHFVRTATGGAKPADMTRHPIASDAAKALLGERLDSVTDALELLREAGNPFDVDTFRRGKVTPVFFGSAFTNFGVQPFFDGFVELAPPPGPRLADIPGGEIFIDPIETPFSAYVFKIQANMNPKHRDSLAFIRVVSGRFERDLVVKHHRLGKDIRLSRPNTMIANSRETVDEAYPGDIVGLLNPGSFAIGDTISLKGGFEHKPLPQFQPELFARIQPKDLTKRKAFDKGLAQLTAEGAVQQLRPWDNPQGDPFIAAVGRLQFEVMQYRLNDEYGVDTHLTPLPYECSAWLDGDVATFQKPYNATIACDRQNRPVVLFATTWEKRSAAEKNPNHRLLDYA